MSATVLRPIELTDRALEARFYGARYLDNRMAENRMAENRAAVPAITARAAFDGIVERFRRSPGRHSAHVVARPGMVTRG